MVGPALLKLLLAASIGLAGASAAHAQTDPADAGAIADPGSEASVEPQPEWTAVSPEPEEEGSRQVAPTAPASSSASPSSIPAANAADRAAAAARGSTVARQDVFSAAEGVFGRGTAGLAQLIEDLLRKQGEPSAYITGREAGGAFVAGVRYGSGTLHHGVEGDRPVYWTGPSLGFDFGADANKVFVLVYNLHDAERIFRRYPAAEGNAYVVGGLTASYVRRGDVVLVPIRLGVGARLGVNAGYMRFSRKNRWLPF